MRVAGISIGVPAQQVLGERVSRINRTYAQIGASVSSFRLLTVAARSYLDSLEAPSKPDYVSNLVKAAWNYSSIAREETAMARSFLELMRQELSSLHDINTNNEFDYDTRGIYARSDCAALEQRLRHSLAAANSRTTHLERLVEQVSITASLTQAPYDPTDEDD
jgi:hypothetical protein